MNWKHEEGKNEKGETLSKFDSNNVMVLYQPVDDGVTERRGVMVCHDDI